MMREVALLLAGGIAVGAVASLAGVRLVRPLLYGISTSDAGWLALAAVAAAAGYLLAHRAARLDPLDALRQE
jgi:ABC-type antimicrobial peptide transport system permease subunit